MPPAQAGGTARPAVGAARNGLWFDFQPSGSSQGRLPRIAGKELGGTQGNRHTDVQQIETPHPKGLGVCGSQALRLPERIGPRDRNVDKDVVREVRINRLEGQAALYGGDSRRKTRSRMALRNSRRCKGVNGSAVVARRIQLRTLAESACGV